MKKRKKKTSKPAPEQHEDSASVVPTTPAAPAAAKPAPSRRPLPAGDSTVASELAPALSESEEPVASKLTLPVLIIPLLGLLIYVADVYLMDHSGQFNALVYYPNDELPKPPGGPSLYELGRIIYERKAQCAQCHQANGSGNKGLNAPPLAGSDWVQAEEPNRIIRIVLDGLSGPIEVSGQTWSGGAMIGWKEIINDEEIAAVLTYIRQSWGNNASDVTPEQVSAIRGETADRSSNWTAPELLRVPDSN